jgi:hypothetical protein
MHRRLQHAQERVDPKVIRRDGYRFDQIPNAFGSSQRDCPTGIGFETNPGDGARVGVAERLEADPAFTFAGGEDDDNREPGCQGQQRDIDEGARSPPGVRVGDAGAR